MKKFKWPAAVIAFILTLALVYLVITLIQRQMISEPLSARLQKIAGVSDVKLKKKNKQPLVVVSLDYVENFSASWQLIDKEISEILGRGSYSLLIDDKRSPELEQVYTAVHFSLYEGEMTGNFTAMAGQVEDTLNAADVDEYRLFVDEKNIYLQIKKGENYLLTAIERRSRIKEGEQA